MKISLPKIRLTKNRVLFIACVVAVISVIGVLAWVFRPIGHKEESPPPITYSTDTPSETKIDKNSYKWKGADDEPRYISLPSIGAGGFIEKVGVDQNKQIATTSNIYFAGWFVDSVKPGQKGLSIIDGHVTGRQNDGIFKDLASLKQGDTYTVEMGNGQLKTYEVMKVVTVDVKDAVNELFSQNPRVSSQLNLITCGGPFNKTTRQYEQRVIVQSKLVT